MAALTITIHQVPPSNNQFIGRNARWKYQDIKKQWAILVRGALGRKIPPEPYKCATVHIHYVFGDRRKRDPDNYSGKMVLDPLVTFGVLQDDNFACIRLVLSAEYQKDVWQTIVTIDDEEAQCNN